MCQGQVLWKKRGSYPIELCSPLCSLLVSYAAHSVPRPSRLCRFYCGKGTLDQHYDWENWSCSVKPAMHQQFARCARPRWGNKPCGSDAPNFLVDMTLLFGNVELQQTLVEETVLKVSDAKNIQTNTVSHMKHNCFTHMFISKTEGKMQNYLWRTDAVKYIEKGRYRFFTHWDVNGLRGCALTHRCVICKLSGKTEGE